MPRFYISDGHVPGVRCPNGEYATRSDRTSDVLNEAQAVARGRKLVKTSGPPRSWTPLDLPNLLGWYDPTYADNIVEGVAGRLQSVTDRSGVGAAWTAPSASTQPTYTTDAALGGQYVFANSTGVGNDRAMGDLALRNLLNGRSRIVIAGVFKHDAGATSTTRTFIHWSYDTLMSGQRLALGVAGSTTFRVQASRVDGTSVAYTAAMGGVKADPRLYVADVNFVGSRLDVWLASTPIMALSSWGNGTLGDTTEATTPLGASILAEADGGGEWAGSHGDYVLAASISNDDRLRLEGYLAHKYGVASVLPGGHIYKTAAPITYD